MARRNGDRAIPFGGNKRLFSGAWWLGIFPGATLALIALGIDLLGDWLRDALNPRLR